MTGCQRTRSAAARASTGGAGRAEGPSSPAAVNATRHADDGSRLATVPERFEVVEWTAAVADFVTYMSAAGRSAGTVRLYLYRLRMIESLASSPAYVTTDILLSVLASPGWSPATRKSVRTSFRTFFRWAARSGRIPVDPAADLPSVSVPDTVPRPTPERVVDVALFGDDPRADFMVRLAAYGGLRCCEIAGVDALDWDGRRLRVRGKGGKVRTVYVHDAELLAHLDGLVEGPAFPSRWTGEPLTPGHVTRILSAALPAGWTGHTLRHRFATVALRGTKDIRAVQIALGHARLETTQRYTAVEDDRVDDVFAAAS